MSVDFAAAYAAIRTQEGRMYTDEVVRRLPDVGRQHGLYREWMRRKASLERLMGYLRGMDRPLRLLDLGCGNGWMSHHLSRLPGAEVLGMDVGPVELAQAARVFGDRENLRFLEGDVFVTGEGGFDVVCMGASVQYFPDLPVLVGRLRELLVDSGELHVFDSPFYAASEQAGARERTEAYYAGMGYPELAGFYHHHLRSAVEALGGELLYDPGSLGARIWRRLGRLDSPFPWYRFRAWAGGVEAGPPGSGGHGG